MKIEECKQCPSHVDAFSDSVLCRYAYEIEHRVLDRGTVVLCPKELEEKKKKRSFFFGKK